MGIRLIKKTNEAESKTFDFAADVDEDAKQFDFASLHSRLAQFKEWVEKLAARVDFEMPAIYCVASGSSGYCYRILGARHASAVRFRINAGTNPERYDTFEGYIDVTSPNGPESSDSIHITSIDELTDELADKIVTAVKEKA